MSRYEMIGELRTPPLFPPPGAIAPALCSIVVKAFRDAPPAWNATSVASLSCAQDCGTPLHRDLANRSFKAPFCPALRNLAAENKAPRAQGTQDTAAQLRTGI